MIDIQWPNGKEFCFVLLDNTQRNKLQNLIPIYNYLYSKNIKTTKSICVYPPRNNKETDCLLDERYASFIKAIKSKGYEICINGVGYGNFDRDEIIDGLEIYKDFLGEYPNIQINSSEDKAAVYWGEKRYNDTIGKLTGRVFRNQQYSYGDEVGNSYFWGDFCKKHINYMMNNMYAELNTLKVDGDMPYVDKTKTKYSNYWFSVSDGRNVNRFNSITRNNNIAKLKREKGCALVYVDFDQKFIGRGGKIDYEFEKNIENISRENGWFTTVTECLDYILKNRPGIRVLNNMNLLRKNYKFMLSSDIV